MTVEPLQSVDYVRAAGAFMSQTAIDMEPEQASSCSLLCPTLTVNAVYFDSQEEPRPLQLPPEIWLSVFSFAVWIPGAFDVSDPHAITAFVRDRNGISVHNRFRVSMDIKLAVGLVCRTWNALVSQFLFEYILVKSGEQALRVAAALASTKITPSKTREKGWWTIRLEIALDGVHIWTNEHTNAVIQILRSCPNLVCFSTAFCTADAYLFYSPAFCDTLAKLRVHTKLKRLEMKADLPLLKTILCTLGQSLEVLWLLPTRRMTISRDSSKVCLPRLHTFISMFGRVRLENLELPSLRTLITDDIFGQRSFIQSSGQQLSYMSIHDQSFMESSLSLCPNLLTLAINCHEVAFVQHKLPDNLAHSSIQCIIVESPESILPVSWYTKYPQEDAPAHHFLLTVLFPLISVNNFPTLKIIRLVLPLSYTLETPHPQISTELLSIWIMWLDKCAQQGIRVEVSQGAYEWTADEWSPLDLVLREYSLDVLMPQYPSETKIRQQNFLVA